MKYLQNKFRFLLSVLAIAVLFSACNNAAPKEAKFIPKDISAVLAMDPKMMQDKLEKAGIGMDTLIDQLFKRHAVDTAEKSKYYALRDSAGIDWASKIFLFFLQKKGGQNPDANVINIMGGLKDAKKFEAFLNILGVLGNKKILKEKAYSYIIINSGAMIAWNETNLIGTKYSSWIKPYYDSVAMKFVVPEKINTEAPMKAEVNRYFTQKESESLASVNAFGNMFKSKSDGYAFSSTNSYLSILSTMPLQLPKLEEMLKDNYLASTLSFDEGKIVATTTTYTNPLVSSILKKYAGPTVNLSMIENYPSDNINMMMLASFNPAIFGGVLKQLEVEGLVNSFMEKTGFSSQELYRSLKGDIAVVVSDLGMPSKEIKVKNDSTLNVKRRPVGKMIFTAPVGDSLSFFKIMNKAVELGYFVKKGSEFKAGKLMSFLGMYVHADSKNFIIASDSTTYIQYATHKTKAVIGNDALNLFRGKSTVAYFDIANTIKGFMSDSSSDYKNSLATAKYTFKDLIASSENFDGSAVNGKLEIRLNNEKQNSLVTLTSLITDIAVDMRLASKKQSDEETRIFPSGVPAIIRTN